jgi:hypothetical protein
MKMMKCHFCQQEGPQSRATEDALNYYCQSCPNGELRSVISSYEAELLTLTATDKIIYAHMYVVFEGKGDNICRVRLHLQEDRTVIFAPNTKIIDVPHFPINPSNVVEKLKLYLLFS